MKTSAPSLQLLEPTKSTTAIAPRRVPQSRAKIVNEGHDERMRAAIVERATRPIQTKASVNTGYGDLVAAARPAASTSVPAHNGVLQRKCACGDRAMAGGECAECSKADGVRVQRSAVGEQPVNSAPPIVHDVLNSPGQPLGPETRAFMEPRFGHDFSRVRVHTDSRAVESARAIDALAYTVGSDIVFGAGRYSPATRDGTRLLAHELAHVVQQGRGVALQGKLEIGDVDDGAERAADLVAARVFDRHARLGEVASTAPSPGPGMVRRAAIHVGRILDEGSCAHLACNSVWACKDDENGVLCPKGTKHAGTKRRPLFTCDTKCENGETCDDTDTWMAIPKTRFARNKCGQDLVICANGAFSHGQVRDRSEREAWEVSPGIQSALGVSGSFKGAIYGDVNDAAFKKDSRCGNKPTPKSETKTTAAPPGGESEPETELVQASPVDEEGRPQEA